MPAVRGYRLPMFWAMNFTVVNDYILQKSYPNVQAFNSLFIWTQAFTYIKVYKSRIHSLPSTHDLCMPHYEYQKLINP
ncbi:Pesticidal crystal cry1Bc [Gossypium arboreum]|uniref:Pesticidal crystal cry1Bc n=1 Tax=Gossypium arboreum TaxID=29729 RepID=A0A0B0P3V8_GOSAR|nr:Pesticidal crystal cry1Bc [Gossypium arboreum]